MQLCAPKCGSLYAALALLFGALLLTTGCGDSARPGTPPKHLVLITVDTLRADHLSSWLYGRPTSYAPSTDEERALGHALAIDDLAEGGVMFRNAYTPRGQTTPAVASLMTGRSPLEHSVLQNGNVLPADAATLAEHFQGAGFVTAGFTSNALLVPPSGLAQGFDVFQSYKGADRDLEVVSGAMKWLSSLDREDGPPIFLWLHFMGPHLPYDPLPMSGADVDFANMFTDPDYTGEANGSREFLDDAYLNHKPLDGLDVHEVVAKYDGEIARINFIVRKFLQLYAGVYEQPRANRMNETALVFAADHGEELHERFGYWAHSKSVYSSVLHVPLILHHPGSLTGRRVVDELVTLEDVAPTLLDWFQIAPKSNMTGRSLLPLVDTYEEFEFESRPAFGGWRDSIFTVRAVVDGRHFRLVWNPENIVPDEKPPGDYTIPELALYEVTNDPNEKRDMARAYPSVVVELKAAIVDWLSTQDRAGAAANSAELSGALEELGYTDSTKTEEGSE
ncbi:MAG: arylsulfatase [Planctomycetota bacterium]|jgi:arylsulfatase